MTQSPISVAIVDDEPLARLKLRTLFAGLPGFQVCGEAGDGQGALELINAERPRLLCLDIRLPGMSGLDVLRVARPRAAVIFTTAFDRYAVTAFELAAVDYLLKPFSRERFLAALERARVWLTGSHGEPPVQRMQAVSEESHLVRLFVREGDRVLPLRTADVEYVEASDDAVIIHEAGRRYQLSITLNDLESRLDPATFLRIHRSAMVNLDHVVAIAPVPGSRFEVQLRGGMKLTSSRQRSRVLRGRGL